MKEQRGKYFGKLDVSILHAIFVRGYSWKDFTYNGHKNMEKIFLDFHP
jgi:hypothetical protein